MYRFGVAIALCTMLPSVVLAHATPVESSPASGANITVTESVQIRFNERLEEASSRIRVFDESGAPVASAAPRVSDDSYSISVPVTIQEGVYTVSWSVVSQDDGHFTKGSYAFSVGSSTVTSTADTSVIKLATLPEAWAIFVEFLGNSILWGVIALSILFIRPLRSQLSNELDRIQRLFSTLVGIGVVAGVAGALAQISIKTHELMALHGSGFYEAIAMYAQTAAGEATMWRILALVICALVYVLGKQTLFTRNRFSYSDALLLIPLVVFAYFRASISHATANLFYPDFSILVNVFHLIEKDLWLGITLILVVLSLSEARRCLPSILPTAYRFLAYNFAALSVTAGYIVWLHVQSFGNIRATEWGENFLKLLSAAIILVVVRSYHAFSPRFMRTTRLSPYALLIEAAAAGCVVFFSAIVIITSPPSHSDSRAVYTHSESGVTIKLQQSPFEDAKAQLTIQGESAEPIVRIDGEAGVLVALEKRFPGGYVFPVALIRTMDTSVQVILQRSDGYDVYGVFDVQKTDFNHDGHGRTFDFFTGAMIVIVIISVGFAILLARSKENEFSIGKPVSWIGTLCIAIVVFFVIYISGQIAQSLFGNKYKATCSADGNMWHLMQPMKAGQFVSSTPREGCMLSSGTYHFADAREYEYLRSLEPANVDMKTVDRIFAGASTQLTFSLKETDGSPAKLSLEHEKIIHVIVLGADMQQFAHIHADEISQSDVENATFLVNHTFPRAGEYLIALGYLHGLTHESKQFRVHVEGSPAQESQEIHRSPASFSGYDVEMDYVPPRIGDIATLRYTIRKDGDLVTNLAPYLGAAMHVAVVKDDLTHFIHTHGEVHPPGYVAPTTMIGHQHAPPPSRFGPIVEAHVIFPEPGLYTVWGEFKVDDRVIPTVFTLRVE